MPGCREGDLAVVVGNDWMLPDERQYIGTFITCGKGSVRYDKYGFDIEKPSQPLLDAYLGTYKWAADSCLQPIRPQPKIIETDKVKELETNYG